jgi:hypothetical protein
VQFGIQAENSYSLIQNNTFLIPDGEGSVEPGVNYEPYGMYFYNYKGTTVTNNTIHSKTALGTSNWGTILRAEPLSTSSISMLENNFKGTPVGLQTQVSAPVARLDCNSFEDNTQEWNLFPNDNSNAPGYRAFPDQGTGCDPSDLRVGNKFYDSGNHIWSNASNQWRYYCRSANSIENPQFATSGQYGFRQNCGGALNDPCLISTPGTPEIAVIHGRRAFREHLLDSLTSEIASLVVDNGNTPAVLSLIADTSLNNASLAAPIISASPLSDAALLELLSARAFSGSHLFAIFERNLPAESPVWEALHDVLDSDSKYDYIVDTLTRLQMYNETFTTKAGLKNMHFQVNSDWLTEVGAIANYYAERDSLEALIPLFKDTLAGRGFAKELNGAYLMFDSLNFARTLLDTLTLVTKEDTLYADYTDLYLDMKEDTLNWLQLDSVQVIRLNYLSRTPSAVQSYAMAALSLRGDTTYHRYPDIGSSSEARLMNINTKQSHMPLTNEELQVFPNPNSGLFILSLKNASEDEYTYRIIDLAGRNLLTGKYTAGGEKASVTINLTNLSDGLYFVEVKDTDNRKLGVQRIVLSR